MWTRRAWQFSGGRPRPSLPRILAAAREAGLDEQRLYDILTMRLGLGRRAGPAQSLADLIATGAADQVVAAIRDSSQQQ
jgi:hypothetical protein